MKTEFDEVRHGYAPAREQNRFKPVPDPRPEDIEMRWPGADWQQQGPTGDTPPWTEPGIIPTISKLAEDAKDFAMAEIDLAKAKSAVVADGAKNAAIYGAMALIFGLILVMAVAFGLILALAERFGALAATGIVAGVLLLFVLITGFMAAGQAKRITRAVKE